MSAPPPQSAIAPPSATPSSSNSTMDSLTSTASSLFSKLERNVQHVRLDMNRNITNINKKMTEKLDTAKFNSLFKIPPDEALFMEIPCKAYTMAGPLIGYLYLTARRVCFYSEARSPEVITVSFPWRSVNMITRAIMKESTTTAPAMVMPLDPSASEAVQRAADVIQFYTMDRQIHQFYGFVDYDKVVALCKYLWHIDVKYNPTLPV
eukprot:TRINITY_DN5174_c0_g1_i2.p1 TRINITY_DN5174_c0_g1~~TRINITY_DN5174_c0_g1_i2.p1  ORF type:complete len:207 (+),score=38.38 TRINITY_DN5174_c0_g1_i2:59-679(+)